MSATTIERTLRRMLHSKEQLNKNDAAMLRELVLSDGYLSRTERKVLRKAIDRDQLDERALEILDVLLSHIDAKENQRAIA